MIRRFTTKSGSIYEVRESDDGMTCEARAVKRSGPHAARNVRITDEWKPVYAWEGRIGTTLLLVWGNGRDSYSANADQLGTESAADADVTRNTITSKIISVEVLP